MHLGSGGAGNAGGRSAAGNGGMSAGGTAGTTSGAAGGAVGSCGDLNQPCCPSSSCKASLECAAPVGSALPTCVDACGDTSRNEICCEGLNACDGQSATSFPSARCIQRICYVCGTLNKPVCDGDRCAPGLNAVGGFCRDCGALGKGCCDGETCEASARCIPDSSFTYGFCALCGLLGTRCCDSATQCTDGSVCNQATQNCVCGSLGAVCCGDGADKFCSGAFVCGADNRCH